MDRSGAQVDVCLIYLAEEEEETLAEYNLTMKKKEDAWRVVFCQWRIEIKKLLRNL